MTNRLHLLLFSLCALCVSTVAPAFDIIGSGRTVLCVDSTEDAAVQSAVAMLQEDFEDVSDKTLDVSRCLTTTSKDETSCSGVNTIIAGTVGNGSFDRWTADNRIPTDGLKGEWETFRVSVETVKGRKVMVVAGSDKRGTAYGLLELSRLMGVSPWKWWADVVPERKSSVTVSDSYCNRQAPSVQFRGIFLNDEENFVKWSRQTFEKDTPDKGAVGPKTYEKVFRLLLRLRANCVWPAMHKCSTPFFTMPGNREMAQRYGIVMGTSHCEPMMRAALEWDEKKQGALNYVTNRDKILDYWESRVREVADGDNIYTIGMRGVHDLPLQGASTTEGKIKIVEQAFNDQRELLRKYVDKDVAQVAQVFVPYKEVLGLYNNGLRVPDDVTLMWCNDNFGYLTHLSDSAEQKRSGGSGVYYHISYWGRPNGYLTLCTQSPALIYNQMRRAYDANARKIWIVNVGDLKPGEFDTEFFLNLAWDINSVSPTGIPDIMARWYAGIFGEKAGTEAAKVMEEYYRLAFERKPEHMGWNRVEEPGYAKGIMPVRDCEFNPFENGDEVLQRMRAYDSIEAEARRIQTSIVPRLRDAFSELVLTPVAMARGMNNKWLAAKKNHLLAKHNLPAANDYGRLSAQYTREVQAACAAYNKLQGGKWDKILALNKWQRENALPRKDTVAVAANDRNTVFWCEHDTVPMAMGRKRKANIIGRKTFIQLFTMDGSAPQVDILKHPKWLRASVEKTCSDCEARLDLTAETAAEGKSGKIVLKVNGIRYVISVTACAEDFYPIDLSRTSDGKEVAHVNGLGWSSAAKPMETGREYTFSVTTARQGTALLRTGMLPTQPLSGGELRYSVSIDGQPWQTMSIRTDAVERDEAWKVNVLRNQSITSTTWNIASPGAHSIAIKALDDGIVLDQMQLDFNPSRQFYSLP